MRFIAVARNNAKDLAFRSQLRKAKFSVDEKFSAKLAIAIAQSGKSKGALASHCGVALSTVSRWLSGSIPKAKKLDSIARFLGVDAKWLIENESAGPVDLAGPVIGTALRAAYFEFTSERRQRLEGILLQSEEGFRKRVLECLESANSAFDELVEMVRTSESVSQDSWSEGRIESLRNELTEVLKDALLLRNFAESNEATLRILREANIRDQTNS